MGREQHVPDSFNHSLYLTKLFKSSYPEGNFGGKKLLDGSISFSPPLPKYNERFAREYRCEPPPEFHLTLPFSSIVHHLSGPNTCALTQTTLKITVGCKCTYPSIHFHCACKFNTRKLAHMLESLIRVSRRIERDHVVRNERQESNNSNELSFQKLDV